MEENYWNNIYWKNHLKENKGKKLDFLSDLWIEKYSNVIDALPKGKALDLGCGLGQYTKYLLNKGFDVISADISIEALNNLKSNMHNANIKEIDMSNPLPFEDETFDLVFANLSIHYFDKKITIQLLKEIHRIIKKNGYFIGTVNSTKTFKFIKDYAIELESNYYSENGRNIRLWDKKQFDEFFNDFILEELHEVETTRWNKTKIMWEFIAKIK